MGNKEVEIYLSNLNRTEGQRRYPLDQASEKPLTEEAIKQIAKEAQFSGMYFYHSQENKEGYFISSRGNDESSGFREEILCERDDPDGSKTMEKIAEKVSQARPGQKVKVLLY